MKPITERVLVPCAVLSGVLALSGCDLPWAAFSPPSAGPRTAEFLADDDFDGQRVREPLPSGLGGKSVYEGRLVFSNLPRAVVDDVLPPNLKLASNKNTAFPNVHPIALLYGHQTDTEWVLPWGTVSAGGGYRELILIVPYVQRAGSATWHNYAVRIYLDNAVAEAIGNYPYGYFKEMASFAEYDSGSVSTVSVFRTAIAVFEWTATALTSSWLSHAAAASTLDNYEDAVGIFEMPILGTLVNTGGQLVCSYWTWNLGPASVRPTDVQFEFLQPFRVSGMNEWVNLGSLANVPKGAFELKDMSWDMRYPPQPCP